MHSPIERRDYSIDARAHLRNAFSSGLNCKEGYFVHGTSLAAVHEILKTGSLPGGVLVELQNRLYMFPLPSRFSYKAETAFLPADDTEALSLAKSYAELSELDMSILSFLKISKPEPSILQALLSLPYPPNRKDSQRTELEEALNQDLCKPLRDLGLKVDDLCLLYKEHDNSSCIVLALSKKLLEDFEVREAEGADDGLYISVPTGLDAKYIVGLKTFSDKNLKFFEKL